MLRYRIGGPDNRAFITTNRAVRPVAVLLAIGCCLSAVSGQWLEKTIGLSDSFGNITPRAVYYVPSSNCVYVAGDDGVIVVDAATHARVARIDMDEPLFMAFDSHDNKVYMSGRESLSVIDPLTHHVLARHHVGSSPTRLCYNPAANKVYCLTGDGRDSVTVVDCSDDSILAHIWVGRTDYNYFSICCNPAGNKVYVPSDVEGAVAVIDGVGDSLLRFLEVGDYPMALAYSPVNNELYCAVSRDDEIAVFDAGPDTLIKLIEVGTWPLALGYNPVSNKVYSGNENGVIDVIDCHTDTVLVSLDLAIGDPMFFVFDSVDNRIFCFSSFSSTVPAISGSADTVAGWVTFHGDVYDPDPACYNPQQNRIYIRGRGADNVFVVDPATSEHVAAFQMRPAPAEGCYVGSLDKFYCSDEESGLIDVVNCSTDSLERGVFTPAWELHSPVYSSGSNKLYYGARVGNEDALLVIDCERDSLDAALPLNFGGTPSIVYNPAVDRIYWAGTLGESTVVAVDCAGDSFVAEVLVGQYPSGLVCSPESNRVYCAAYRGDSLFISAIDCAADTVAGAVSVLSGHGRSAQEMCYIPSQDVVCCGIGDSIVMVDGAAKQVIGYAQSGGYPRRFCLDRLSNKLHCLLEGSDEQAVIDCRYMSLEAKIRLAAQVSEMAFDSIADRMWVTSPDYGCISLVDGRANRFLSLLDAGQSPRDIAWVPQHRRMYVIDQKGQAVLVLRDSSFAGVHENSMSSLARAMPTVIHGVLNMEVGSRLTMSNGV